MTTPLSRDIDVARTALVEHGRRLVADGLVVGSAGNLSMRTGDHIAITPSGIDYETMSTEAICVVDLDGKFLGGSRTPSSEWPMHRKIYATIPGAAAVVHTHSQAAVALSTVAAELPAIHYSILRLGGPVRVAPYETFGSTNLAEATSEALQDRFGALLQNHGAITYGASLEEAYERAQLLEWLAGIYIQARLMGTPRILDEAELDEVRRSAERRRYKAGHAPI